MFLFRSNQEAQKIFQATQPIDASHIRTKLIGTGMKLLDGIDPNPENYVSAGIIHTRTQQIGCLLRLEPNRQAQVRKEKKLMKYYTFPMRGVTNSCACYRCIV